MADVTVPVDGAEIVVTDTGGDGPVLLALHAGVADRRIWDACIEVWQAAGWRVIAPDRRGFGDTVVTRPTAFSHVTDTLAVLDALDVPRATVVGNSMGGKVALHLAVDHPDRVDRLVAVAPAISGAPWPFGPDDPEATALDGAIGAADEAGDHDRVNQLEAHFWLDGPRQPEGRVGGDARELFLDMNGRALSAPDPGEQSWPDPLWDRLGDITAPTTFVVGLEDEHLGVAWAQAAADRITGATVIELPGRAHLPMLEDPAGFLAATDDVLTLPS